jgi:hypothetical protein
MTEVMTRRGGNMARTLVAKSLTPMVPTAKKTPEATAGRY